MMLQRLGLFLVKLVTFFLFIISGIWLGFMAFQLWLRVDSTGAFVRWRLLDGSQNFRHLIDGYQNHVVAQADNGKLYLYQTEPCFDAASCNRWVDSPPDLPLDPSMKRTAGLGCESAYEYYANKDMGYAYFAKPRYPPLHGAKPSECIVKLEYHPDGGEILTYYVLLDNGKVWRWIYKDIAMLHLVSAIRWAFVGLIIGVIIWFRFQKIIRRSRESLMSQIDMTHPL